MERRKPHEACRCFWPMLIPVSSTRGLSTLLVRLVVASSRATKAGVRFYRSLRCAAASGVTRRLLMSPNPAIKRFVGSSCLPDQVLRNTTRVYFAYTRAAPRCLGDFLM